MLWWSKNMIKKNITDIFVEGLRKGWQMGTMNLLPNVVMAFVLIQALEILGLLKLIGKIFEHIMTIFGLPGEAITALLTTWLSAGGSIGITASLVSQGILTSTHVSILIPAIFLMGSQLQYIGRILAVAGIPPAHYKVLFLISIINATLAMLTMRYLILS